MTINIQYTRSLFNYKLYHYIIIDNLDYKISKIIIIIILYNMWNISNHMYLSVK